MKKNRMMRLASVLLIMTLLSTSVISGTFAKYVTTGSASDSARVAAFGVEVSADYSNLFKSEYATSKAWEGDDNVSVKSNLGGDVVAPGTYGDLADFTVTGQPEVDVNVSYVAELKLENWTANNDEYCPIIFSVNNITYGTSDTNAQNAFGSIAVLEQAVEEAIAASTANYNAGTDLADDDAVANDLAVSWAWAFEGNDEKDTILGNWQKNGVAAPTISLEVSCTVTQID